MKHHYWEPPIALYLFLGGLAGGILFLSAIFNTFVVPGYGEVFAMPVFWSLVAIAIGCVFLVVDLGQPGVFSARVDDGEVHHQVGRDFPGHRRGFRAPVPARLPGRQLDVLRAAL